MGVPIAVKKRGSTLEDVTKTGSSPEPGPPEDRARMYRILNVAVAIYHIGYQGLSREPDLSSWDHISKLCYDSWRYHDLERS